MKENNIASIGCVLKVTIENSQDVLQTCYKSQTEIQHEQKANNQKK